MITITQQQLLKKVEDSMYKSAIIYDGSYRDAPKNIAFFLKLDCVDSAELSNKIQEFCEDYSGMFTFIIRRAKTGHGIVDCISRVNILPKVVPGEKQPIALQGNNISPEKMRVDILAELKAEMQLDQLKFQNEIMKSQLQEQSTMAGRLGLMAEQFFKAKMGGSAPMFQNPTTQLQGTKTDKVEQSTDKENEKLANSMKKLIELFGAENINKMAENYNSDSMEVQMINSTLNSK